MFPSGALGGLKRWRDGESMNHSVCQCSSPRGNGEAHSPFFGVDFRQVHPAVGLLSTDTSHTGRLMFHASSSTHCAIYQAHQLATQNIGSNIFFRPRVLRQSSSSIAPTAGRYFFKPTMLSTGFAISKSLHSVILLLGPSPAFPNHSSVNG